MVKPLNPMFWRNESGVTLVEGIIVFPLIVFVFSAFVEFGYAVHQWNLMVKATQVAARALAVLDPASPAFYTTGTNTDVPPPSPGEVGNSVPAGQYGPWTCGYGTGTPCETGKLNLVMYGNTQATSCNPVGTVLSSGTVKPAICHFNPNIKENNLKISYSLTGLGYYGRPGGPVLTITVEIMNVKFNLPVMGAFLGLNTITIPSLPVTITSEDLKTN